MSLRRFSDFCSILKFEDELIVLFYDYFIYECCPDFRIEFCVGDGRLQGFYKKFEFFASGDGFRAPCYLILHQFLLLRLVK